MTEDQSGVVVLSGGSDLQTIFYHDVIRITPDFPPGYLESTIHRVKQVYDGLVHTVKSSLDWVNVVGQALPVIETRWCGASRVLCCAR